MKKFFKILGTTITILILFFMIGAFVVLRKLPSPAQIGGYLRPSTAKSAIKTVEKEKQAVAAATESTVESVATNEKTKTDSVDLKTAEDRLLIDDMMNTTLPLSSVCNNLASAKKVHLNNYSLKDFGQAYKDSVLTEEKDPVVQAIKPSLRYVFNLPMMKDLMKDALAAADSNDETSFMHKAGFYAKAYAAYSEMKANQNNIEQVMDRSYHLMVLSKVVAKKPELVNDSAVNNYCRDIESSLNTSAPVRFDEEREAFNEFMQESGVVAKDVDYDPNYRTHLKMELNNGRINMKGGWIQSVLKPSPEELRALSDEANRNGL